MADGDNQYKRFKGFKVLIGDESNPTFGILVDDASKALHICEPADQGIDWDVAADTHPSLYLHSATTPATDYIKLYHDATDAYINGVGATALNLQIAGTTEVSISAATVTLASSNLTLTSGTLTLTAGNATLTAGNVAAAQGYAVYLDGQGGGEFIASEAANDLKVNATAGVYATIAGATVLSVKAAVVTAAQKIAVDDTTDSTSTTTGSIQTDGGLGVAKSAVFGDSIYLANGKVLNFNSGDVTLTHSSNLLTLAGGGLTVTAGQFISGAPIKQTATTKTTEATLTAAESGLIVVNTDAITMYLPTYVGNTGLTYTISARASYGAGVIVNPAGSETIDGATTLTSGAQYSALTCVATATEWTTINRTGTWA